jgi:hypothetical protein
MADPKDKNNPTHQDPGQQQAQHPAVAPKAAFEGVAPVSFTPNPNIPTSTEWAQQGGPPTQVGYIPPAGKQIDIFPRPPLDPATNFLDINVPCWGEMLPGLPGQIVDIGIKDVISRVLEGTTNLAFGTAVALGTTGDGYCKPAAAATDKILGIAMRDMTVGGGQAVTALVAGLTQTWGNVPNHGSVAIVRVGRVWAQPATAVHEGDPVSFVTTAGADQGKFNTGGTAILGAHWASSAPAGMMAQIQFNLP